MGVRVNLGVRIPEEIDQELQRIANEQHLEKSDIVRDALSSYVDAVNSHRCPECQTMNDQDAVYCKQCGRGLKVQDNDDLDSLLEQFKADPDKLLKLLKEAMKK